MKEARQGNSLEEAFTLGFPCQVMSGENVNLCDWVLPDFSIDDIVIPKIQDDGEHGIDLADLPHSDDGEWLHRPQLEEAHWDLHDEEEKACSDRSLSPSSQKPVFSKVFGLGRLGKVSIPATFQATEGSPTACIKADPYILKEAISTTLRMQISFKDKGKLETHYGTGFIVSPTMVLTAGHCLDKPKITSIKACQDRTVLNHNFEEADAWEGKVAAVSRKTWSRKDRSGLFVRGVDIGSFSVSAADSPYFLLPCSPAFLSESGRKTIAVISFPAVDGFLKEAKKELVKGDKSTKIWKQYKPIMKSIHEKCLKDVAKARKVSVTKAKANDSLVQEVEKKVKQDLFDELYSTFAVTHTGTMVCSVGSILHMNEVCFGSSYSSLRGSSGAAVVSLERPGEFIGIHHGGSTGYDLNIATSTDNPDFVVMYVDKVLPTLPHPHDPYWSKRDMSGFKHWLHFHAAQVIKKTSPWYAVAKKGLKRKRV